MADNITVQTVNARVDKMGSVFIKLQDRLFQIATALKQQDDRLEPEAETLLARMDELYRSIQASPAIRRQADIELADLKDRILPIKDSLDDIEANEMFNIGFELGENGKVKYSNDKARAAALRLALAAHDEYQTRLDKYHILNLNRVRLQAQVDEIERKDKNDRVIYGGCVARLADLTKRRM